MIAALGLKPSTLSVCLAVLERAGLVRARREGKAIHDGLDVDRVGRLIDHLVADCCRGRPELCAPLAAGSLAAFRGTRRGMELFIAADKIRVTAPAELFGVTKNQLAETAGLPQATLSKASRSEGARAQARLREVAEILVRVEEWTGGKVQAFSWRRAEPIPAFGGGTAEALVEQGKAAAVRGCLDHVALGGFS